MPELAQEIHDLAARLAAYGRNREAKDTEAVLRILLADSIIAVTADLR